MIKVLLTWALMVLIQGGLSSKLKGKIYKKYLDQEQDDRKLKQSFILGPLLNLSVELGTGDDTNYPQKGLNGVRSYRNLKSGKLIDCR